MSIGQVSGDLFFPPEWVYYAYVVHSTYCTKRFRWASNFSHSRLLSSCFIAPTEHESETHRVDSEENPSDISSSNENCRSKRSTEEKPDASSSKQPSAQIPGDETGILDSRNSKPVSEERDTQYEELIVGSGSDADPLKIDEPEAVQPCDDSTDFADPRRPEVIASRSACPAEEETSKHPQGKLNVSATRTSSAWSSQYSHKLYLCNPTHGSE